jgi:SAM-dependent methyltransferase
MTKGLIRQVFGWERRQQIKEAVLSLSGDREKERDEIDFWRKEMRRFEDWFEGRRTPWDVPPPQSLPEDRVEKRFDRRSNALVTYALNSKRYQQALDIDRGYFKGRRVLDVGCGPLGHLASFDGCERYGVDPLIGKYEILGYPLGKVPIKHEASPAEALPFQDGFFDAVISVNALDHVECFEDAVSEIARVTKRGGEFICSLNYRDVPTPTEPEVFDEERVRSAFAGKFTGAPCREDSSEELLREGVVKRVLWKTRRTE